MPYKDRYVAFVDILGFGEIVRNSVHSPKQADELASLLQRMSRRSRLNDAILGDDFRALSFSNSIVMSSNTSQVGLQHLLNSISELASNLLEVGILMRGAVAKGSLHHDDRVMFGPAFLDAYYLEKNVAKFPRIIVGRQVYHDYRRYPQEAWDKLNRPMVDLDDDGPAYLDTLAAFGRINSSDSRNEKIVDSARTCQKMIQYLLDTSMHEPRHYEKVRWLGLKWNAKVSFRDEATALPVSFHGSHI